MEKIREQEALKPCVARRTSIREQQTNYDQSAKPRDGKDRRTFHPEAACKTRDSLPASLHSLKNARIFPRSHDLRRSRERREVEWKQSEKRTSPLNWYTSLKSLTSLLRIAPAPSDLNMSKIRTKHFMGAIYERYVPFLTKLTPIRT